MIAKPHGSTNDDVPRILGESPAVPDTTLDEAVRTADLAALVRFTDQRHPTPTRYQAMAILASDHAAHIVTFAAAKDWLGDDRNLDPELRAALVATLRAVLGAAPVRTRRSRESERALLGFIASDDALQRLALEALSEVGTPRALPALIAARKRAARKSRSWIDGAVDSIRRRSPVGALSLATDDAGTLELSADEE